MEKTLERQVLDMLIDRLGLEDIAPETIDYNTRLFAAEENEGLGLDSVDALELVVGLKNDFGVEVTDEDKGRSIFLSIQSIADYIREKREELILL